jgi:carbon-monoxide dehydrogenase medium subunit
MRPVGGTLMKARAFDYRRVASVAEALDAYAACERC